MKAMNKRKILIHGAHREGWKIAKRVEYIFDIIGFIDRNAHLQEPLSQQYSSYRNLDEFFEKTSGQFDFIVSTVPDFYGLQSEYVKKGVPFEKILDFVHVYDKEKYILHQSLINEIYRRQVDGAVAELGVDYGDTAKYLNFYFPDRPCYLFDTFCGFDERDKDPSQAENMQTLEIYNVRSNAQNVLKKMPYPESCVIKEGIFPESLNGLEDRFAFVHIDCDLYQPILAGLEYFYPRLNKGGYIAVHDFYNLSFPMAKQAVRDFADQNNLMYTVDFFSDSAVFFK